MDRPIMNPWAFDDPEAPGAPSLRQRVWQNCLRLGRGTVALALRRPFRRPRPVEDGPWWHHLAVGLLYRLVVAIFLGALIVAVMLTVATHPPTASVAASSQVYSFYYDPISFLSLDGTRLSGWLIPALDAGKILSGKEEVLRKQQPAVVLVHDYRQSRRQMVPLIQPLHDAGFVVLAFDLRGCGQSESAPQTFGLREWMDVKAAVQVLRRRSFVDAGRMAIVGIGAGANAAAQVASADSGIEAVVLENPCADFNDALGRYVLPEILRRAWIETAFRWTFGAIYRTDVDQLGSAAASLDSRRVLSLSRGLPYSAATQEEMIRFLQSRFTSHTGS